jgi:hypothetical protein
MMYLRGGPNIERSTPQSSRSLKVPRLENIAPGNPTFNQNAVRELQIPTSTDLVFHGLADIEALLDSTHGCPLFQKFSMMNLGFRRTQSWQEACS